ncbi:hypothetical protein J2W27_004510 [Variovorax boronicumulans]|uniref:hypothetical protein n=1 Tax=Variovorax boronicumulans TaxID=436515 RepID=UPI00278651F0|nr:hypothetical protein [Variovorax boronicumulans]MDP9912384.1 hypothetical protein [Variovorax boronicumulans]
MLSINRSEVKRMTRSGATPRSHRRFWLFFSAIAAAVGSAGLFIAHGIALMAYDDNWEAGHWQAEHFNAWVDSLSGPLFWVYWLTKIGAFVLLVAAVVLLACGIAHSMAKRGARK